MSAACLFAGSSRQRAPLRPQSPSAVFPLLRQLFDSWSETVLTIDVGRLACASTGALSRRALPLSPGPSLGEGGAMDPASERPQEEGSSVCNRQERTDDLSFAARHAPYELLERRGFAAHPCAARELEQRQTSSGGATKKASSLASAEELRRRQVEAARLPDGGKQLSSAVAAQLVAEQVDSPMQP
eukprot:scaffold7040_cov66-Phaeocystis_antarctica.AAC.4